jgi:hypothetical protein
MDPRTIKMWQGWEAEVRADLLMIAQKNGVVQEGILDHLAYWDRVNRDEEQIGNPAPVSYDLNRDYILSVVLQHLTWAFTTRTRTHCPKLRQIIHENRDVPVRNWPTIKLTTPQGDEVIGFRIPRVVGGDGQDYRYYYFPEEYVKLYGREAARKQVER